MKEREGCVCVHERVEGSVCMYMSEVGVSDIHTHEQPGESSDVRSDGVHLGRGSSMSRGLPRFLLLPQTQTEPPVCALSPRGAGPEGKTVEPEPNQAGPIFTFDGDLGGPQGLQAAGKGLWMARQARRCGDILSS